MRWKPILGQSREPPLPQRRRVQPLHSIIIHLPSTYVASVAASIDHSAAKRPATSRTIVSHKLTAEKLWLPCLLPFLNLFWREIKWTFSMFGEITSHFYQTVQILSQPASTPDTGENFQTER